MIKFGKCKKINGARVSVEIVGFSGNATIDCLLMQPCAGGPSTWLPPAVGDVLVVAVDEERPEDSVVLGAVYPDGKQPPKTDEKDVAFAFSSVYLGSPIPSEKSPREDRLQGQLRAIKAELDAFVLAFNAHTHTIVEVSALDAAAIVGAAASMSIATTAMLTSEAIPQHTQGYVVSSTASDCVYVR